MNAVVVIRLRELRRLFNSLDPAPAPVRAGHRAASEAHRRADGMDATRSARVFDIDISRCPPCRAAPDVLAVIADPRVIAAILAHFETPTGRGPPGLIY